MNEPIRNRMPLLTPETGRLLETAEWSRPCAGGLHPVGVGTWLATETDADGDFMFGLAA